MPHSTIEMLLQLDSHHYLKPVYHQYNFNAIYFPEFVLEISHQASPESAKADSNNPTSDKLGSENIDSEKIEKEKITSIATKTRLSMLG